MNAWWHGVDCAQDPCDWCQNRAEEQADNSGHEDNWQHAQTQYEAHLDRMGGAA